MGSKHNELEKKLGDVLKVKNLALCNNGTTALLIALKVLDLPLGSEIITTAFTFPATVHSIVWSGCTPVFCDIEPNTMTIDPYKIEELITPNTSAILGVHVYGYPCDVYKIEKIAEKYKLKVVYDAAHAFSMEIQGRGIGTFGNISMFSFHATKLFNTIEGGGLACNDSALKEKICALRNFGIVSEEEVDGIGINGKMNEFQAAMGLENLKIFRKEQEKRAVIKALYDRYLLNVKGIRVPKVHGDVTDSYQYYPIIVEDEYFMSRDELYENLKNSNVYARKYFYPVCSDYPCYKDIRRGDLSVTNNLKNKVLCLPYYGDLEPNDIGRICKVISHGY